MANDDGGLPGHITKITLLGSGHVYRCTTCGSEGGRPDSIDHHDRCPAHEQEAATDGGETTEPLGWSYRATVHGATIDADCLALTGSGKPCSYNAYQNNNLPVCNTHAGVDDPDIVADAHQWARITDGTQGTVTVCVACETVWSGPEPETLVACPECSSNTGERCRDETSSFSGAIPPHPKRRQRAYDAVEDLEPCPAGVDEPVTDGGEALKADPLDSWGQFDHGDRVRWIGPDKLPNGWSPPLHRRQPYEFQHETVDGGVMLLDVYEAPKFYGPNHPASDPKHWTEVNNGE